MLYSTTMKIEYGVSISEIIELPFTILAIPMASCSLVL